MNERVFLGLGANIGNREANLQMALRLLGQRCDVVAVSSLYECPAVVPDGAAAGPDFLNAACEIATDLDVGALLLYIKQIEHALGRRPSERWAPRPIDIDILLYGDLYIEVEGLAVPHPLMHERAFVLLPLAEIAGGVTHPVLGRTIGDLAERVGREGTERIAGAEWASGAWYGLD